MRTLGYRERQVLDYTRDMIEREGVAPSYGMIARELRMYDRAAVRQVVAALERKRLVARAGSGRVRRVRLLTYTI